MDKFEIIHTFWQNEEILINKQKIVKPKAIEGYQINFDELKFNFEGNELLWNNQGTYSLKKASTPFPRYSKRQSGEIRKYDTWTLEVRLRHLRKDIIVSDDLKRIRVQAKVDSPGEDPTKWSFFYSYFPFYEIEQILAEKSSKQNNYKVSLRDLTASTKENFQFNGKPKHPRLLEKKWREAFLGKPEYPMIADTIANALFDNETDRAHLIKHLNSNNDEIVYALIRSSLEIKESEFIEKSKGANLPSKKEVAKYRLSTLAKKNNFKLDLLDRKNSAAFVKSLFKFKDLLDVRNHTEAWKVCLAELNPTRDKRKAQSLATTAKKNFRE